MKTNKPENDLGQSFSLVFFYDFKFPTVCISFVVRKRLVTLATQEDCGSKSAQANNSGDPILKKTHHKKKKKKKAGEMAQGVGPKFKL
jgi:hypothetical protein